MAGRSSAWTTSMVVENSPGNDLALTNCDLASPNDLRKLAPPGSDSVLALVADSLVLTLRAIYEINDGHIGLNSLQRWQTKVSAPDQISLSRFIPPDNFDLALLSAELEFVKKANRSEEIDAVVVAQKLRKRFADQVVTTVQRVLFELCGTNYSFTVNQAMVEGADKSKGLERGSITPDTCIVFETIPNSGIKLLAAIFSDRESLIFRSWG